MDPQARLQALQAHYHSSLPGKQASVELAWRALCADSSDPARLESLMRLVHRLAGSATSYGYQEIGEIAGSADAMLAQVCRVDETESNVGHACEILEGLTPLIARLLQALERASSKPNHMRAMH